MRGLGRVRGRTLIVIDLSDTARDWSDPGAVRVNPVAGDGIAEADLYSGRRRPG